MQRYPFAEQDGVDAVRLYIEAGRCYQIARQANQVIRIHNELAGLKRRLNRDYQSHRLQLRLALDNARYADALREARILRNLLYQRDDAYTQWLDQVARKIPIQ